MPEGRYSLLVEDSEPERRGPLANYITSMKSTCQKQVSVGGALRSPKGTLITLECLFLALVWSPCMRNCLSLTATIQPHTVCGISTGVSTFRAPWRKRGAPPPLGRPGRALYEGCVVLASAVGHLGAEMHGHFAPRSGKWVGAVFHRR